MASVQTPDDRVPLPAIERAARVYLYELTAELRRHAYRSRPVTPDPKPKDRHRRRAVRQRIISAGGANDD